MSGGLAFVLRILGHEAYVVLFPSMLPILPELGHAALARGGSLEVIVLPFLLLRPFRCEDCPGGATICSLPGHFASRKQFSP